MLVGPAFSAAPCTSYRNESGDRVVFVFDGENTVIYEPVKAPVQTCDWMRMGDEGYTPSIDCGDGNLRSHFIYAASSPPSTDEQGLLILLDTQDVFYRDSVCHAQH